jgi:gliding-associated putative ABC transporter substrate-binding component GldG
MENKGIKNQYLTKIAIIIGIIVLVNILSVYFFTRFDLTKDRLYTLSDASKNLVKNLDDKLTIKAFFSEDLPAPYNNNRRFLKDQLDDYRAYSKGNLQYEFVSVDEEKTGPEAQKYGIPPVQVQVVKEDKMEVKKAYMGLVFLYEDKQETIPVIQSLDNLEYEISSIIKRLTSSNMQRIGLASGHGEPSPQEIKNIFQLLSKQYQVIPVELKGSNPIPADINALLVISPDKKFSEPEKFQIDQYIMKGGKAAFMLNKFKADLKQQFAQPLDLGMDDMLLNYGVKVNNDIVIDAICASVTVMQQAGGLTFQNQIPYPAIPVANEFNENVSMVKGLKNVVFFFISSLDTAQGAKGGSKSTVFIKSSRKSGRLNDFMYIDPTIKYPEKNYNESGIPLAVTIEGSLKSFYAGKPVPQDTSNPVSNTAQIMEKSPSTRIVVMGDGDFMKDEYLGSKDNLLLLQNIVDYLVDDIGLISIRTRQTTPLMLEQTSEGTKKALKYGSVLIPPALVIIYGLFRWRMRNIKKKASSV